MKNNKDNNKDNDKNKSNNPNQPIRAGLLTTFKAVAWSFIGIRKSSEHTADMERLNPVIVIIAGLILCAVFVITLVMIVNQVVS